ncbi:MAG: hypothetical protein N2B04_04340 [Psychrobacter sp.]
MAFCEWWELSKAMAKDKQQSIKDMAIAMRMSQLDKKEWDKFMKG